MKTIQQILNELNSEQKIAVMNTLLDPTLLLAGPGSGKTRVLQSRYLYLLSLNVPWYNILAVTFTNKAAGELKERIGPYLPPDDLNSAWIGTFHSMCIRLLHIYGKEMGISNFTIADTGDSKSVVKNILDDNLIEADSKTISGYLEKISDLKSSFVSPPDFAIRAVDPGEQLLAKVYTQYEDYLRAHDLMDFDDIIVITARKLEEFSTVKQKINDRFKYVMIDECQDTDTAQHKLIKLIGDGANIFMVGDTDQSLYGWRGARPEYFAQFTRHYPGGRVLELNQNYRSTGNIIKAANAVIQNNIMRYAKKMATNKPDGDKITICRFRNSYQEAETVVKNLKYLKQKGYEWGDITILYRVNSQSRVIEDELVKARIPYKIIGGVGFYDRMEVRDIMAWLKVLSNPSNDIAMRRVMEMQPGIGKTSVTRIRSEAEKANMPMWDYIQNMKKQSYIDFITLYNNLQAAVGTIAISDVVENVLTYTDYINTLTKDKMYDERLENLDELREMAFNFESQNPNDRANLTMFIEQITLVSDQDEITGDNTVKLMTGHAAKGLEFKVVFMVGCEENLLPHANSKDDAKQLEEERRICFVMMTRAQEILIISHALERRDRSGQTTFQRPSRFLKEIPAEFTQIRQM